MLIHLKLKDFRKTFSYANMVSLLLPYLISQALASMFAISTFVWALKVARMVNIKLFFMDWFYYDLIILIKQCKIPYKNLDKAPLFSRNLFFFSEKLKMLTNSNYHRVKYFLLKLRTNVYKRVFRIFFLFCLDLELFAKIKKTWSLHTRFLHFY